jgi:hypothetical protein
MIRPRPAPMAERIAISRRRPVARTTTGQDGWRQVFEKDVTSTGFQLPQSWTYQHRFYGLEKGTYRWVVWPLLGRKPNISQGPAIVSARYVV